MPDDWKVIDQEVQAAFEKGTVLQADRATLDRWLVALTGRIHTYQLNQMPMQHRLEVLRHLTSVRLAEESERRRDQQQATASAELRRHNRATRWIAVGSIIIAAVSGVLSYLKPCPKPERIVTPLPQFGLVAEEVEKVSPDLVVRDQKGKPYTVRYDQVNAMLLNEFLKEHRTVQEQQNEIDVLRAELKQQRELIQKVNDKVELAKPTPQAVNNP